MVTAVSVQIKVQMPCKVVRLECSSRRRKEGVSKVEAQHNSKLPYLAMFSTATLVGSVDLFTPLFVLR
jgi:hypothetical protein